MGRTGRRGALVAVAAVLVLAAPNGQHITAASRSEPAVVARRALSGVPDATATVDVAIEPAPAAFDGPPAAPLPPPATLDVPSPAAAGTWAVIIGINDYPGQSHDLRAAVADADDMGLALTALGVAGDRVLVLRDGQATGTAIRRAIAWLTARAAPDAVAAFFYAGHVRKLGRGREAIVGADGVALTDQDLAREFAPLAARRAWFAFAACYGGGFTEVLGPGRVLTGAAGAEDLANENSAFGRSYLVEYMVRRAMIEGRASTSVQAGFAYAQRELARDHPNRQPVQIDRAGAPIDLRPAAATQRAAAQPASAQTPPSAPYDEPGGAQPPPSASSPPPHDDGCAQLTAGVVRCSP